VLIWSHIFTAAVSLLFEVAWFKYWHSIQAVCEIVRIPSFFYVIMYASYKVLNTIKDEDEGCSPTEPPLHETLITVEIGIFFLWVVATPIFLILAKILDYDSREEKLVEGGYRKAVSS